MSDDFFLRLERQLEAAELRELKRAPALRRIGSPRRLLSVPLAVAAAVGVVVGALAILGAIDNNDAQPVGTVPAPDKKVEVVTDVDDDVDRGIHFVLDGRVLTVRLLPPVRNQTFETVDGARISATCGAPPGDPRRETTLTQRWPDGQTSTSYRFPRDVSSWCRLEDQSGSILASAKFPGPGVPPGATDLITETANNWVRLFASSAQACNEYTAQSVCEQVKRDCQRKGVTRIEDCRRATLGWAREHRGATVQRIAISGDRAAATFSNAAGVELETVQLRRTATGEWLIDRLGPIGAVGSSK
jgi:hypothetical protein